MSVIEDILTDLGIEFRSAGPNNVKAFCINPMHEEKQPSMHIHKELGIVHCFGCSLRGNIFTLLTHKGIIGLDALQYLEKFSISVYKDAQTDAYKDYERIYGELPSTVTEQDGIVLPAHRKLTNNIYLENRGITPDDIKKWKMGVVTDKKNLGWIIVPIYQDNKLCNYFIRSTYGMGKLYGNYPRKHILAGLDFCTDCNKAICVSEGIFDAISVSHTGFQSVACLSNRLLEPQLQKLKKFKEVIIVPDNDVMGLQLVESAGVLIHHCPVWVLPLPPHKKDAGECTVSEILQASMKKLSWAEYLIRKKYA